MRIVENILDIYDPHPKQLQFLLSWRRHELALTGVGFGKSWILTLKCLLAAVGNTGSETMLAGRTYRDLQDVLLPQLRAHCRAFHERTGVNLIKSWNKTDNRVNLLGGGAILIRSYQNNVDALAGLNLSSAFVDEVEVTSADRDKVFSVVTERCRVVDRFQTAAFASTPNGLLGVARIFFEAQARHDPDFHVTIGRTQDNPHLSQAYLRTLAAGKSKARYQQQVLGHVLRPQHVIYPEVSDALLIDWDWRAHQELPWVLYVDWGTGNHNVAGMVQVQQDGTWIVADELLIDDCPRGKFRAELLAWVNLRKRPPVVAATDRAAPTENGWLRGVLISTHVRSCVSFAEQSITNGIEMVRDHLDPADGSPGLRVARSLVKPYATTTAGVWQALRGYRYKVDREGNPYGVPFHDDLNDHSCDGLRYAYVLTRRDTSLHGGQSYSLVDSAGPPDAAPGEEARKPLRGV